jgi:hypothetical protein
MIWSLDKSTEVAARCHPLPIAASEPAKQWPGHPTKASTWNDRVIQPAIWPAPSLQSSPDQIMEFFQKELYTQAVAMVVSWGGMGRRSRDIYRQRSGEDIQRIEKAIRFSAGSIRNSGSISGAWTALTGKYDGELGWSAVMTSKSLHFLCRSLGFEDDPPVPIDNKVIRQIVWPKFRNSVLKGQRPAGWNGNTFAAYCRYMTAALIWAGPRGWTTTQMENTIFDEYLPKTPDLPCRISRFEADSMI